VKVLFALPGLHRHNRGAEVAFISIAEELVKLGDAITLIGSGAIDPKKPYRFLHAGSIPRERFERFPFGPVLRHEYAYEELTFVPALLGKFRPCEYDVTVSCSYPFTNWVLRRPVLRGRRPPHVYVTENGDWPAVAKNSEYRFFGCDGLVCTNPEFYERNKARWRSRFIPNGVDFDRFSPGQSRRTDFGLPEGRLIVLMVSALIPSKRISAGIEIVSRVPGAHLVVAGDGPLREELEAIGKNLLPDRFTQLSVSAAMMPSLYRSANVFLHLSKDEPSSLAFLEAMACGLPLVAHDLPQLRYIVGDDEFLVDTDNAELVSRQILLAQKASQRSSQKRSKLAETFSWQSVATQYRNFFHEIVNSLPGDPKIDR
jgi:glycosyltransferase involved in cell wall biosynthesis